jgi:hypothetical protein
MNYQKAYKEALAHAREIHRNEEEKRRDMEFIFPELKESDDEKVRKAVIAHIKDLRFYDTYYEEMCQETIDWFEKKCFPYALESENPARESINWLKSIKQKIKGE